MRTLMNLLGEALLVGAIGMLAACGSGVTNNGSSGAGGAAGDDRGDGGSGGGDGGTTSEQTCLDFCHHFEENDCAIDTRDCATYCSERLRSAGDACDDELAALFVCLLPYASSCPDDNPAECDEVAKAFQACDDVVVCSGSECSGGGSSEGDEACDCESLCGGKEYASQCENSAGGTRTCVCLVDGVEVGTCEGSSARSCGVTRGCCQEQYFNIE